jgi:hypothetical protein
MIKLFSLIFNLCPKARGDGYASTSLYHPKSSAQTQFENQKLQEFVSHLLCLNSRDQLSQQVPTHLSSSILLSNTQTAGVLGFALRDSLKRGGVLYSRASHWQLNI